MCIHARLQIHVKAGLYELHLALSTGLPGASTGHSDLHVQVNWHAEGAVSLELKLLHNSRNRADAADLEILLAVNNIVEQAAVCQRWKHNMRGFFAISAAVTAVLLIGRYWRSIS